MYRLLNFTFVFPLAIATSALAQQFPPQPTAPQMGSEVERAACRPDVVRFCRAELSTNQDDVFAILTCLQRNRSRLSAACRRVLEANGK